MYQSDAVSVALQSLSGTPDGSLVPVNSDQNPRREMLRNRGGDTED